LTRGVIAEINLDALTHNLNRVRSFAPQSKILAMIKSNGYGHGLVQVASALQAADAFGVATLDEAIRLRKGGCSHSIVLMQGFHTVEQLQAVIEYQLVPVVHSDSQLEILRNLSGKVGLTDCWLKFDTGMTRLGFACERFVEVLDFIQSMAITPVLMTHFSCADHEDVSFTEQQIARFNQLVASEKFEVSSCNSAAVIGFPAAHGDWVRPGMMLYGISPFTNKIGTDFGLRPAMSFKAKIIAIKDVVAGVKIGYGACYTCTKDMRIAVVNAGYGDGYPRMQHEEAPVLCGEQKCRVVGQVSMDMITIDVSDVKHVTVGDEVLLWGHALPVEWVSPYAGTISYELINRLTARVKFKYYNSVSNRLDYIN
jgi:alanine racemase